ncbi:transmembrane channel-like protein 7 isoform X2 [Dreissena polymorpha]|uniref:transmembrane channel-like protein 7 isoform X2 n=1 Tax=Dreissena polymorpha TaxID=45954 RepID=UPI00226490C1|nr:transmembrane channel-like protein 7 isoform X2 [Dreissena polymorpha]
MMAEGGHDAYRSREYIPMSTINPGYEDIHGYPSDSPPNLPPRGAFRRDNYPHREYREDDLEMRTEADLPHRGNYGTSMSGNGSGTGGRNWAREETPRDTAILLESLPSKQLEKLASEIAHGNSSVRRRSSKRRSLRGIHIPTGQNVSEELIQHYQDDPDAAGLDDSELKAMTLRMSDKRRIRNEVTLKRETLKRQQPKLSRWKQFKYNLSIQWRHFKYSIAEVGYFFKLWRGHLKKIEGHFGSGVLSYFLFLKWLFYINIPVFILTFGFVILPQILYEHLGRGSSGSTNTTFKGWELLTGSGWFEDTELYYGHYTNTTINLVGDSYYNMKYAYLFTCGGYYLLCLFILAFSISKSYKKNYIEGSGAADFYYVSRVFCGWDYGITAKNSAVLKHVGIYNEFKEYLSGVKKEEEEEDLSTRCKWFWIRVSTNILVLAMIGGAGYLIYYVSDVLLSQSIKVDILILNEMAMPLTVSGVNLILPFLFSFVARFEAYKQPKNQLYINMTRTMLLKAATLGVLVYFWYQRLETTVLCRETFIGQQIYRLVIVDFVFILLTTFFVEFVRRLMKENCFKSWGYPEFEIGRNTLNLIYSQALCWLGTYFSPMLSLIMIIKLFIIFYVKRFSVVMNCKPSLRPWRASRAHTIFLSFLLLFYLLTLGAIAYAIIFLKPSEMCGPFRQHKTSYEVVVLLIDSWKAKYPVLVDIISFVSSSGFIAATLGVLLVLTYYMRIVMVGHKEMVKLLRDQLLMEGRDKSYLLNMLQTAHKKGSVGVRSPGGHLLSAGSEASGEITTSPADVYDLPDVLL